MHMSLLGVFSAGLLTFLSPCVLPIVPVYLSILAGDGDEKAGRFRTILATALFVLGFTIVFSLMGLSATVVGRILIRHKLLFQQVGGVVVLLLGLRFMGYLNMSFLEGGSAGGMAKFKTKFHYLNVFVLGLLFAFAWTPCIGSVLGAVLTYTSLSTTSVLEGALFLGTYSMGFAVPLLLLAIVAEPALAALKKMRRFIPIFEKVTGVLLVVVGMLLVTDNVGLIDAAFATQSADVASVQEHPSTDPLEKAMAEAVGDHTGSSCNADAGAHGSTCDVGLEEQRPKMIEIFSTNCPVCRQMIPNVNALRNTCRPKPVDIELVNTATKEGREIAHQFGVTGIPVFIFLDENSKETARLVGYQPIENLEQAMTVLLGEECKAFHEIMN